MKESWKDVEEYEGTYQVSNLGRVRNIRTNHLMKNTLTKEGYYVTKLSKNGTKKIMSIHRLVANAFLPQCDFKMLPNEIKSDAKKERLTVNHIDENKTNNRADNLEWCTNRYNIVYSSKNKRKKGTIQDRLLKYMRENGIDDKTIKIILKFF